MTTLEYIEVFIEYSSKRAWGENGRWFFIVILQLTKFIGRVILTYHYKNTFVQNPPIPALDRKKIIKNVIDGPVDEYGNTGSISFTLKRSGRVVRKVEGAPPVYMRNWKSPVSSIENNQTCHNDNSNRVAEILYICKPLIHLGSVGLFGYNSWKSWASSLILDLFSLRLYHINRSSLTKEQRVELSRRCVCLLLYLMRSPFYDRFTGNKITALLNSLQKNIPIAKAICSPIESYIPQWQNTYFYMWST